MRTGKRSLADEASLTTSRSYSTALSRYRCEPYDVFNSLHSLSFRNAPTDSIADISVAHATYHVSKLKLTPTTISNYSQHTHISTRSSRTRTGRRSTLRLQRFNLTFKT